MNNREMELVGKRYHALAEAYKLLKDEYETALEQNLIFCERQRIIRHLEKAGMLNPTIEAIINEMDK